MRIPRPLLVGIACMMVAGGVLPPIVWQLRQPEAWQPGAQPVDTPLLDELSCDVEEACGALRAPVEITLGPTPRATPEGQLPPGYLACAAKALGTSFGEGPFALAPCKHAP